MPAILGGRPPAKQDFNRIREKEMNGKLPGLPGLTLLRGNISTAPSRHRVARNGSLSARLAYFPVRLEDLPARSTHLSARLTVPAVWLDDLSVWLTHSAVWLDDLLVWLTHSTVWLDDLSVWLDEPAIPVNQPAMRFSPKTRQKWQKPRLSLLPPCPLIKKRQLRLGLPLAAPASWTAATGLLKLL